MDAAPQVAGLQVTDRSLNIAVMAMGGQGGGVLVDWIVALAESAGHVAQSTAVPGVAQRTGATLYYVELVEQREGPPPILALMPAPGEVDVVIGAELMEAGRAMQRGLVTPDRTTLIASSHRGLAIAEKEMPGDGIAPNDPVYVAGAQVARRFICFDMQEIAEAQGSVVSAVLFGALAASNALPFARENFEATIRAAGVGVAPSLRAFGAGFDAALAGAAPAVPKAAPPVTLATEHPQLAALSRRLAEDFPAATHLLLTAGLRRVVDFQDADYGAEYLDRVATALDQDDAGFDWALTTAAAKYVAVAMAYDDVIRVADLKTRATRFDRVRREQKVADDDILLTTEFMHPRIEEVCGLLPARLGRAVLGLPLLLRLLRPLIDRPRRVRTGSIRWFVPLYLVAGLRRVRRGTLRHAEETAHLDRWLRESLATARRDRALALEMLRCRRLVKGYSDTHARGLAKFDRVMAMAPRLLGREDAADWLRRLREAALRDEEGAALDAAIATVETFL